VYLSSAPTSYARRAVVERSLLVRVKVELFFRGPQVSLRVISLNAPSANSNTNGARQAQQLRELPRAPDSGIAEDRSEGVDAGEQHDTLQPATLPLRHDHKAVVPTAGDQPRRTSEPGHLGWSAVRVGGLLISHERDQVSEREVYVVDVQAPGRPLVLGNYRPPVLQALVGGDLKPRRSPG
jgi:hypothetical protein